MVPAKVGKRMTGAELQLVMRHQAMQLQITDPINDEVVPPSAFLIVLGFGGEGGATKPARK